MTFEMDLAPKKQSFGGLFEAGSGSDIVIVTPGTFVKWPSSSVGNEAGLNYVVGSDVNDNMTIGKNGAGNYFGIYKANISLAHNQCVQAALFKNDAIILESQDRRTSPNSPKVFADSINLINGTLDSGSVPDTRQRDGVPYSIREVGGSPGLKYEITFIDKTKQANVFEAIMKYIGLTSHAIKARVYNNDTTVFDDFTAAVTDFPASLWYYRSMFKVPGSIEDYYDVDGKIIVQIDHTSPGNTNHLLDGDEFAMVGGDPFVTLFGTFNQFLNIDDFIDLRFDCPLNAKIIKAYTVSAYINRVDKI